MKTKQVQEQSRKLQNMDALVNPAVSLDLLCSAERFFFCYQMKKNLVLEDQIVHVLQQNEDLKVRIDNCQTLVQYVLLHSCLTVAPPAGDLKADRKGRSLVPPTGF